MTPRFILLPLIILALPTWMSAQSTDIPAEKQAIMQVIHRLFDGMRQGDSSMVRSVFTADPSLYTAITDRTGKPQLIIDELQEFLNAVGSPHEEVWDERVWTYDIAIDGNLASAWTPYAFFADSTFIHCGVDAFQLFKSETGWKIFSLSDTRRKNDCMKDPVMAVNIFLDRWHNAAATADEEVFFGSMTADGVYIGTDAAERWTRDEMRVWAQPHFDKETAWAFTPISRNVYFSEDGKMAWFEENLDTWMGVCHGSGVLQMTGNGWKIRHYVLSVAVPNDIIKEYLKLLPGK